VETVKSKQGGGPLVTPLLQDKQVNAVTCTELLRGWPKLKYNFILRCKRRTKNYVKRGRRPSPKNVLRASYSLRSGWWGRANIYYSSYNINYLL